jgi:hypothetical protein
VLPNRATPCGALLRLAEKELAPHEERAVAMALGQFPVPPRPTDDPLSVIRDVSFVRLEFNVMPGRTVTETFHFKEYRVWPGYVEAAFDRTYESAMEKSPSHVVFLTAEAHAQKLAYIALAQSFGRPYDAAEKEYFKIWWTCCFCHVPNMIRDESNLTQALWIIECLNTGERSHALEAYSRIGTTMELWARARVFLI